MADEKKIKVSIDGSQAKEGIAPVLEAFDSVGAKANEVNQKVDSTMAMLNKAWSAAGPQTGTDALQQMSQASDLTNVSVNKLQSALTQGWRGDGPKSITDVIKQMRTEAEAGQRTAEDLKKSFDNGWNGQGPRDVTSNIKDLKTAMDSTRDTIDRTKAALTQGGWTSGIEALSNSLKQEAQAAKEAEQATNGVGSATQRMSAFLASTNGILAQVRSGLGNLISVGGTVKGVLAEIIPIDLLSEAASKFFEVTNRLQGFLSTMSIVTGSVAASREQLFQLFDIANKYGVNVTTLNESFAKLSAAAKGTTLEGEKITKVFESIVVASSAMHLSAEDTRLVLYALQQMVSKGTVSFEELRRQMAERFPGAMTIAAQSMGLTQQAFQDLVKSGKLFTEDFLPGFAQGILQQFSPALEVSSKSVLAAVNRMQNAWEQLIMKLSTSELTAAVTHSIDSIREALSKISDSTIEAIGSGLASIFDQFVGFLGTIDASSINKFFEAFAAALQLVGVGLRFLVDLMIDAAPKMREMADSFGLFARIVNNDTLSSWQKWAAVISLVAGHAVDQAVAFTDVSAATDEAIKKYLDGANAINTVTKTTEDAGKTWSEVFSASGTAYAQAIGGMEVTSTTFFAQQSKNWSSWGDQVSRQAAAAHRALINMSGDSGDQISRQLESKKTGETFDKDQANQMQRIVDLTGELYQARLKTAIGLKDEITVRQRLKNVIDQQAAAQAVLDNQDSTRSQRITALQDLKSLEGQYLVAKKAVDQADKEAAKSADSYNGMLGRAQALLKTANDEYATFGSTLNDKVVPAQKELNSIENSNSFKKLSADRQQAIRDAFQDAIAQEQANLSWKDYYKTIDDVGKQLDQFTSKDSKLTDEIKNRIQNLNDNQVATKNAATTELEHYLALDKTQQILAAMDPSARKIVDDKIAEARASALAADAEKSHYDSLDKFVKESDKASNSLDSNTKQLYERAAGLALTKEQQDKNLLSLRESELGLINEAIAAANAAGVEGGAYYNALIKRRDALDANVAALQNMANAENLKQFQQTWVQAIDTVSNKFADFVNDVKTGGWSSAFKKIWDDFTHYALTAIAKVALQKIAISIFPQLSTAFDQGNNGPLGSLATLLGLNLPTQGVKIPPVDIKDLQKSIQDAADAVKYFKDSAQSAGDAQKKAGDSAAAGLSNFIDKANLDARNLADFGSAVVSATADVQSAFGSISSGVDSLNGSFITAETNLNGVSSSTTNFLTSMDSANNDVTGFGANLANVGATASTVSSQTINLANSSSTASNQLQGLGGAANSAANNLSQVDGSSKDLYGNLDDFSGSVGDASSGLSSVASSSGGVVSGFAGLLRGMGGFVSSLFSLVGSLFGGGGGGLSVPGIAGGTFNLGNNASSVLSAGARFFGITPAASGGVIGANISGGAAGAMDMFGTAAPSAAAAGISTGSAFLGGLTSPLSTLGTAITGGIEAAGGLAAIAGAAIPVVGGIIAIASAAGLFDHKPSEAKGQFQISPGTTGFEDNAYVASPFGNLGFNDANTQQFSGEGAKVFDTVVQGALQAFSTRFAPEQSKQFADVLKNMTFEAFSGTYTTEDFIQKYGGQVLQQIVVAGFQVLDPALASVVQNFKGTADEVAKFSNTLLSIYDATKSIGNADFTKNIDAALQGADQAAADKINTFVTIVSQFGTSIDGLGTKLESLDSGSMTAFIDSLGGADNAMQTMKYINDNFTTSAQKTVAAQNLLNNAFKQLNLAVPQTHQDFLNLLNSFDLTTDSGRQLYASVAALAPLFVEVKGTADQAVSSISKLSDTFLQLGQSAIAAGPGSGQGLDSKQTDYQQVHDATTFITSTLHDIATATYNMHDPSAQVYEDLRRMNGVLPLTDQAWQDMIRRADDGTTAGHNLAVSLTEMYGAQIRLNQATQAGIDSFNQHFLSPSEQSNVRINSDMTVLHQAYQDNADILHRLGYNELPTTTKGWHDFILFLQSSTDPAIHALYLSMVVLSPTVWDVIDATGTLNDTLSQTVVSVGSVIQATLDLKKAGADAANKLLTSISDLAGQSTGSFGEQLATQIGLITTAIQKTGATLTGGGVTTIHHRGQPDQTITQPLSYTVPGGDVQQQAYVDTLATQNTKLIDQLRRFNELTVQYGDDIAKQLVDLQDWRTSQYQIFAGMPDDLAVVDQIFQQKWDSIINGSTAAAQSLDDFIKSLDSLVDSSHGTLGQRLSIELNAAMSKMLEFQGQLNAPGATTAAKTAAQANIDKLQPVIDSLSGYIQDFTSLSTQYGADIAGQLVALEQWRDTEKVTLQTTIKDPTQLASALSTLNSIFTTEFQGIIDGSKNAGNSLEDLKQKIRDFIDGLKTGDLSPLTPLQKLQSAKDLYEQDLSKAKTGDTEAMGRLTDEANNFLQLARSAYASSQQYTDIFNKVMTDLSAISDYVAPAATSPVTATTAGLLSTKDLSSPQPGTTTNDALNTMVNSVVKAADEISSAPDYTSQFVSIENRLDTLIGIEQAIPDYTDLLSRIAGVQPSSTASQSTVEGLRNQFEGSGESSLLPAGSSTTGTQRRSPSETQEVAVEKSQTTVLLGKIATKIDHMMIVMAQASDQGTMNSKEVVDAVQGTRRAVQDLAAQGK